ncbi:Glycylpeptide N-tetradecanoyltransferase 1 [Cucumispora dikerogammari]|nr:Glycylpeptide N-tetradecanoyltransferase 1 [Cucumispora dikerogammari]
MSFWSSPTTFMKPVTTETIIIPVGYKIKEAPISEIPEIIRLLNTHYISNGMYRLIYPAELLYNELRNGFRVCLYEDLSVSKIDLLTEDQIAIKGLLETTKVDIQSTIINTETVTIHQGNNNIESKYNTETLHNNSNIKNNESQQGNNNIESKYNTETLHNNSNIKNNECHNLKLVGFIHVKFINLSINSKVSNFASINFLCLHSKHRNKNLAPLLITYARAISNVNLIFSGIFTGSINLPKNFNLIKAQYFHKILPNTPILQTRSGVRLFMYKDTPKVIQLLRTRKSKVFESFIDIDTFYEKYKTVKDSVYSIVFIQNNVIVEFGSFFIISTTNVIDCENHIINSTYLTANPEIINVSKNAYLYLYYSKCKSILYDLFAIANKLGCEMFNMLNINNNREMFDEFQVFAGTGNLNYYLFNYNVETDIENDDVDFVML